MLRHVLLPTLYFSLSVTVQAETTIKSKIIDNKINSIPLTININPPWIDDEPLSKSSTSDKLTESQLDVALIRDSQNLQLIIPGMVFTTSSGVGDPSLRGIGGTVSATGDPGIATFIDGVYQKRVVQSLLDFYDIDSVSVSRGPSMTAYGHGVEAGAISVRTRDPEPEWDAFVNVLTGSYNQRELKSAVNIPLSDSTMAFRFAGIVAVRDGFSENVYLNKDLDDRDYYGWRGKFGYRPSQQWNVIVSTENSVQNDTQGMGGQPDPDVGVNGGIASGGTVPADPRNVMRNIDENQDIEKKLNGAKIIWQANNFEVLSITAQQNIQLNTITDLDSTEVDYSSRISEDDVKTVSQEFRVRSDVNQKLAWEAGVFYIREKASQQLGVYLPSIGVSNITQSDTTNKSYSVFASLSYAFTSQWRSRIGVRDNHDQLDIDLNQTVTSPMGTQQLSFKDDNSWQAVTPEISLIYSSHKNREYYASVSKGYKSGGYNAYAIQPSYTSESLLAYELGVKLHIQQLFTRANASLFYYDYKDMQIITLPPGAPAGSLPIIGNAARASVYGLDLQTSYHPGAFSLLLGATFINAHFDEFTSLDPNNPASDPDRSGGPLPKAPEVSLVMGGEYHWRLSNADLRFAMHYHYRSKVYFNSFADPDVAQDAYSLINANLRYENIKQNWFAELYGRNLTDKLYAQNVIRIDPVVGTRRIWGDPRTVGINLGYRF